MPTVEVNGNIDDALFSFKSQVKREGIVGAYKRRQQYIPPHEQRARKAFRAECRRRRKERGKK